MSSAKKKKTSVFSALIVIVLLLTVALTITANVFFSGNMIPQVAGYYLYLHEESDMQPDIPQNSFVIAKNSDSVSLSAGNKVLCRLSNGSVALRLIYLINLNEDNSTSYFVGTAEEQGSEPAISKNDILAVCTWASPQLYQYVKFSTSITGLLTLLVLPCIILIIMLLVKILKSNQEYHDITLDSKEEPLLFEDPGPSRKPSSPKAEPKDPLFNPEQIAQNDESLEKKKSSIQENFSAKPVNEDSPYQRAIQERGTAKFDIPKENDISPQSELPKTSPKKPLTPPDFGAPAPQETPVSYLQKEPSAQPTIRKQPFQPYQPPQGMPMPPVQNMQNTQSMQMPIQPQPVPMPPFQQNSVQMPVQSNPIPAPPVPPVPVVDISKVQPMQNNTPSPEQIRSAALERERAKAKEARRETSPNIDDILMASQMKEEIRSSTPRSSHSEIARTDSIDDLIAVLEKKKNNL